MQILNAPRVTLNRHLRLLTVELPLMVGVAEAYQTGTKAHKHMHQTIRAEKNEPHRATGNNNPLDAQPTSADGL